MKKPELKEFILLALIFGLIVQVLTTSGLYESFTRLTGTSKTVASYFIAFALEFGVFMCIRAGSRSAGAWFAIGLFFAGILFHDYWGNSVVDLEFKKDPPFIVINELFLEKKFMSSTLLQFMISLLIWFFSDLYSKMLGEKHILFRLAELQHKVTDMSRQEAELQQKLTASEQKLTDIEKTSSRKFKQLTEFQQTLKEYEQREKELKEDITSLQKKKAGMSRLSIEQKL
jgi:hypothetical protein